MNAPLFQCVFYGMKFFGPQIVIDGILNGCTVAKYNPDLDTTASNPDDELVEVTETGFGKIIEKPTNRQYPE